MADPTSTRPQSRGERKERTRRRILDAALALSGETSLVALSLRQVTKEVGIVPTAFYRHFDSVDALGLALVEESFVSLRALLRDVRRSDPARTDVVDRSVALLVEHVHRQRAHFRFIARERAAGPTGVRAAIRDEIEACERGLAADLARLPGTASWSAEDLRSVSNLAVTAIVATAEAIVGAPDLPGAHEQIVETARVQLRMVLVGALNWRSQH